jgi:magnesium chelatase family protein
MWACSPLPGGEASARPASLCKLLPIWLRSSSMVSSSSIVEAARNRQRERFRDVKGVSANAEMHPAQVREFCELDAAGQSLIKAAMRQLHLSARAYHRILKLARTIADLAGSERIEVAHLAEAVQYRPRSMA